ncbi:MAG: tetratricopeptide repeat protein [Arcicella sp.]|nr:tetratricopeptide repeat protein [Arcicella sp.]
MIFYRLILLIIIGVFAGFYGFSKCPDYYFIVSKIQQIEQKKNKNIDDLHKIEVSWNVCNYPKDSTYGLLLLAKLNNYFEIGQYEKCIPFGKETLTILSKTDTKVSSLPKVYFTIAYSYFSLKEYEYAKEFFMKVVRNSKVKQHQTLELDSYFYLANLFQQEGDYQLAYQNITYALNLATKINDKFFIADIWREKANIERQLGNYKGAVVSLDNALKYALGYKDKEKIARVYELKGRVYEKLNDYKVAIESYKNALQILGSLNKTLQTTINTNIGYLYSIKQEKYDLALFYFEKALKLSVDSYQRLGIYDNIAYAYTKKRDFEQAIKFYQLAYKEVIHRFNERGNENPSPEFIKKLIKKKNILTLIKDKADTWLESYKTNSKISDLKHALDTYLLADNLITFMRWEQTGEETKLFWREKTHKMYESAIETCSLIKDYSNAFYFFEKSRAVLLNDKLNELGAKQNLSNEDKKYEIELQSKIEDLRKKLSDKNSNIETLEKELFLAEDTQEKFIKSLETKNPTYYQLKYETKIADLKAVQNYLKEIGGGSLVEYFLGDSTTYAIIVSSNSVAIKKLNYDKNVAQKFLNECSKRLTTKTELIEFNKLSYQVFQNLVEPLNLPKGRVIISQDGVFLPFEALSKVANKAEFIVNDYMISYTYSAQFLLKNREKKGFLPNRTFIGFAPVNFTQKLMKFPKIISGIQN